MHTTGRSSSRPLTLKSSDAGRSFSTWVRPLGWEHYAGKQRETRSPAERRKNKKRYIVSHNVLNGNDNLSAPISKCILRRAHDFSYGFAVNDVATA